MSIGMWVLRSACEQNKRWQDAGLPLAAHGREHLRHGSSTQPKRIREARSNRVLALTGLDPSWLELEMTESVLWQTAEDSIQVLRQAWASSARASRWTISARAIRRSRT